MTAMSPPLTELSLLRPPIYQHTGYIQPYINILDIFNHITTYWIYSTNIPTYWIYSTNIPTYWIYSLSLNINIVNILTKHNIFEIETAQHP